MIVIDQISKIIVIKELYNSSVDMINNMIKLTYVENRGGAFGIGDNNTFMFIIVNVIIITIVTKFIISKKNDLSKYILISLGLILSGGISNLIDRITRGFVVDYIDVNPIIKYPIFNIADICIFLGCTTIIVSIIYTTIKSRRNE